MSNQSQTLFQALAKFLFALTLIGVVLTLKFVFTDQLGEFTYQGLENDVLFYRLALAAIGFCALVSSWSYTFAGFCKSCSNAGKLVKGLPLGQMGHGFYLVLFGIALVRHDSQIVLAGMFVAAAIHLVLVALLVRWRVFCATCFLVAISAIFTCVVLLLRA